MASNILAELPSVDVIRALYATRYFAAAGLVCVFYDHVLTLKDELKYIWGGNKDPLNSVRIIFLFIRYSNEAGLLLANYLYSGMHEPLTTSQYVLSYLTTIATLAILSMGTSNVFMTLRHYALWDGRVQAKYTLWAVFIASYGAVFVFWIFVVQEFHEWGVYNPVLNACVLSRKPVQLIGVWAGMVAFDIFTIGLAVTNAFDRPFRHRAEVISNLLRDGALFFVALLGLRILNLVLAICLRAEEIFLIAFFVWAMLSITLSRLVLRVEAIKAGSTLFASTGLQAYEMQQYCEFGTK